VQGVVEEALSMAGLNRILSSGEEAFDLFSGRCQTMGGRNRFA